MRNDTVENFLQSLAAKVPAPGGGATAALHAAQAAALVARVARYSEGPRFAEHVELVQEVRDTAARLRGEALTLADDARAAATTSRVNIEINLGGISGTAARAELRAAVNSVDRLTERADKLTSTVRAELTR